MQHQPWDVGQLKSGLGWVGTAHWRIECAAIVMEILENGYHCDIATDIEEEKAKKLHDEAWDVR